MINRDEIEKYLQKHTKEYAQTLKAKRYFVDRNGRIRWDIADILIGGNDLNTDYDFKYIIDTCYSFKLDMCGGLLKFYGIENLPARTNTCSLYHLYAIEDFEIKKLHRYQTFVLSYAKNLKSIKNVNSASIELINSSSELREIVLCKHTDSLTISNGFLYSLSRVNITNICNTLNIKNCSLTNFDGFPDAKIIDIVDDTMYNICDITTLATLQNNTHVRLHLPCAGNGLSNILLLASKKKVTVPTIVNNALNKIKKYLTYDDPGMYIMDYTLELIESDIGDMA